MGINLIIIKSHQPCIKNISALKVNMNTTQGMRSILALMAVTTTALVLGASTAFAASSIPTHHHIQITGMSSDYFPTPAASNTHTHHHIPVMSSGANSASTGPNSIGSGTQPS